MKVKEDLSYLEKIRKILKDQNGVILTSDLARFNIPRTYLSILQKNNEIEKVSRGAYKIPSVMEDEMHIFQASHGASIYSHETALFLHDLTDRNPLHYSITVPSGYHSSALKESGYKIRYLNQGLFGMGVISMSSPYGNDIRVTNLERTICDILRSRNRLDIQYVNNALKRYVTRKDKNINLLYEYAKRFRIQKIIRQTIEVLL